MKLMLAILLTSACANSIGAYEIAYTDTTSSATEIDQAVNSALTAYVESDTKRIEGCTGLETKKQFLDCLGPYTERLRLEIGVLVTAYADARAGYVLEATSCATASGDKRAECVSSLNKQLDELQASAEDVLVTLQGLTK